MKIPFNIPYLTGKEIQNIEIATRRGKLSGNGYFTKKCHDFFEKKYGFKKALMTSSCTDALEMAALLCNIEPEDEVILPSFTFVSTANAFALRGATLRFADVEDLYPNIAVSEIEKLINPKTKAIVVVHYCGVAVDMDAVVQLANKHQLYVIEDCAHAIDSYYKSKTLGGIGHLSTFSFHETKNLISGEGGLLVVNDETLIRRAEIIWEKGTNRVEFARGEVDKYGWEDIGSSYLASEITAAFLSAQLDNISSIQQSRIRIWKNYYESLIKLEEMNLIELPQLPEYSSINGNFFFFMMKSRSQRDSLITYLNDRGVQAVFHYLPLHESNYFKPKHDGRKLLNTKRYADRIVRLPFYTSLSNNDIRKVVNHLNAFFYKKN